MTQRPLLVLLVEPQLRLAALFQLDLTEHGHRVNAVYSAEHALGVLTPEYDIVVTDLHLPTMTGEQFILAMRSQPAYVLLPVLVISTEAELPASVSDSATRLRQVPFDLQHFVAYVSEAAGPIHFRN